jgi:hypothetical protein
MIGSPSDTTNKIFISTGIILILLSLCAIWSIPYGSGDLYISLAAGHDVLAGKLGAPDDWSFSTDGRVWMNQNWGADVILYLVESAFGDTGLLAVKFLLLTLSALFLFLALHEQKIKPVVNLVVTAVVIISINMYAVLRPNLFSLPLCALELWLLFKSVKHPSCLWIAALVTLFWANVHAGFILGLGMLCLWVICRIVPELWGKKRGAFRHNWQLLTAVAAAFVFAGLVNPFGFNNLIHPFTMMKGSEWNTTLDWLPIWDKSLSASHMSSILSYLGLVCVTLLLLGLRFAMQHGRAASPKARDQAWLHGRAASPKARDQARLLRKKNRDDKSGRPEALRGRIPRSEESSSNVLSADSNPDSEGSDERSEEFPLRIVIFEALLALVTLVMAVLSNRFIILALVALTPLLAGQFAWLCRIFKFYRLLLAAVSGFVLVFGMLILFDNVISYDSHNPVMNNGTGSLFEKMHFTNKLYDKELIRFINTNRISGHIYCPWKWEGYLRMNCPQLKLFIGGRAQQIYSIDAYDQYMYTSGYDIPAYSGKAPTDVLNAIGAHYLIAANSQDSQNLVLTALNCGNWVIVYADAQWLLFANTRAQNAVAIINLFTDDKLIFEKEATRAMSRAAHLLSQVSGLQMEALLPLFREAWKYEPNWLWSYWILYSNLGFNADFLRELVLLMKEQLSRLEAMSLEGGLHPQMPYLPC